MTPEEGWGWGDDVRRPTWRIQYVRSRIGEAVHRVNAARRRPSRRAEARAQRAVQRAQDAISWLATLLTGMAPYAGHYGPHVFSEKIEVS